jgi:hypothetical protein
MEGTAMPSKSFPGISLSRDDSYLHHCNRITDRRRLKQLKAFGKLVPEETAVPGSWGTNGPFISQESGVHPPEHIRPLDTNFRRTGEDVE